jgi:hypothetical protein
MKTKLVKFLNWTKKFKMKAGPNDIKLNGLVQT